VRAGTSLGAATLGVNSGKTVTLTAGARDIYVVVEDTAGNISAPLKIEAAAYVIGSPTDDTTITNAKDAIDSHTFAGWTQAAANTESTAVTQITNQINGISGFGSLGVGFTVNAVSFTAAIAGTSGNPTGTNGTFTFTVSISKGGGTPQTSSSKSITITATEFVDDNTGTPGLSFAFVAGSGDTEYSVSRGSVTSGAVVIPAYYNGLPVTTILNTSFLNRTGITSIFIPATVTTIMDGSTATGAFFGCTNLESVVFGSGSQLETIGSFAFYNCRNLESIVIPANVKNIGSSAFRGCTNLESIVFENGSLLETIGNNAFRGTAIASITIPGGVTSVGQNQFRGCPNLVSVFISEGVPEIGGYFFTDCTSLETIVIPASITVIGEYAFNNCNALSTVFYGGADNTAWGGISIDTGNARLSNAAVTRYYYSATSPSVAGNFWRWVGGVPTVW